MGQAFRRVGRDPEVAIMRPPVLFKLIGNFFGLFDAYAGWSRMLLNAAGRLGAEEASYIPASEAAKVIFVARIWTLIYAATLVLALILHSILPFMVIGLPRLYGAWHHVMTGLLQHGGLADNVTDHRLNSRTVYMNPISRFIYWNMNYHVEHHMFPMIPYHALPRLHDLIKNDLPPPNPSIWDGYREVFASLKRQKTDPEYAYRKVLPATARPYREEFHNLNIDRSSH